MEQSSPEQQIKPQVIENFSQGYIETIGKQSLFIDSQIIAADRWQELVNETQKDQHERMLVVSKKGEQIVTSKTFAGEKTNVDMPLLPHGIKSLFPNMKDMVAVHTHPMFSSVDRLKTTILTETDILSFADSGYKALVMVDRGGAHLLFRNRISQQNDFHLESDFVNKTIEDVSRSGSGMMMDVIKKVSEKLLTQGLGYFYTPELSPNPKGYVEFHDPRSI